MLTKAEIETRLAGEERFEAWRKCVPSSRLHPNRQRTLMTPVGMATPIFCINCGRGCGAVSHVIPDIVVLCDACYATHGGLPAPELPQTRKETD